MDLPTEADTDAAVQEAMFLRCRRFTQPSRSTCCSFTTRFAHPASNILRCCQ